jgi:TetR/AcrR family transcriptional regulator
MPRNEQQNEQAREARREQIRKEALRQFALQGLGTTRIQDIAIGVGMAQGLLYHYYPSKEAIYLDLVREALDITIRAAESVRDMKTTAREKIEYSLRELVSTIGRSDRFTQTCSLNAQIPSVLALTEEERAEIRDKKQAPYRIVADIMRQGQREGSVVDGDADSLAMLFWSCINGLAIYRVMYAYDGPLPDFRVIAAMFLKNCKDD